MGIVIAQNPSGLVPLASMGVGLLSTSWQLALYCQQVDTGRQAIHWVLSQTDLVLYALSPVRCCSQTSHGYLWYHAWRMLFRRLCCFAPAGVSSHALCAMTSHALCMRYHAAGGGDTQAKAGTTEGRSWILGLRQWPPYILASAKVFLWPKSLKTRFRICLDFMP